MFGGSKREKKKKHTATKRNCQTFFFLITFSQFLCLISNIFLRSFCFFCLSFAFICSHLVLFYSVAIRDSGYTDTNMPFLCCTCVVVSFFFFFCYFFCQMIVLTNMQIETHFLFLIWYFPLILSKFRPVLWLEWWVTVTYTLNFRLEIIVTCFDDLYR